MDYISLLNLMPDAPLTNKNLLVAMRREGLVSGDFTVYSLVRLESEGYLPLLQLRQNAKQQDDDARKKAAEKVQDALQRSMDSKKQWRHEWFVALASAGFGSVVTLCIEHSDELFRFMIHAMNQFLLFFQALTS